MVCGALHLHIARMQAESLGKALLDDGSQDVTIVPLPVPDLLQVALGSVGHA
ncbi:hypothetical protein [Sorangium sp. So ce1000]|uniref:hypothetical protein n=1 Tax=Sorangium sp. So ce1000 TaxID=3133325 RepID=UPI003F627C6D